MAAAAALLLASTTACGRAGASAEARVAPFGGELAAALPYQDVIGLARFRPGDLIAQQMFGDREEMSSSGRLGLLGPPVTVLELLVDPERTFLTPEEPFAILFLDTSVHGGLAAFAWRGDAEPFRVAARAAGLRLISADRINLPGIGRVDGLEELFRLQATSNGESFVPYHILERDGMTLLAPARDGARNLLATLEATRALAPDVESGCFRFDAGRALTRIRDDLRRMASPALNMGLETFRSDVRLASQAESEDGRRRYWSLRRKAFDVLDALLDLGCSTDHVFAHWNGSRAEVYLSATEEGFLRDLLNVARNLPVDQLVAGAPQDAEAFVAMSLDPKVVGEVPAIWRASKRGFFQRQRSRDPSWDLAAAGAEEEAKPRFLDSFDGRCWFALSATGEDEEGGLLPFDARVFAGLVDDETNEGLLRALLDEVLPSSWMKALVLASITTYRVQRVTGGCLEVVGSQPGVTLQKESRRLVDPEPFAMPWDGPHEAFFAGRWRDEGMEESFALFLTADGDGVRAVVSIPRR